MLLSKEESYLVCGGASVSGSLLNAVSRLVKTIYDIGYALGSAIKRVTSKKYC